MDDVFLQLLFQKVWEPGAFVLGWLSKAGGSVGKIGRTYGLSLVGKLGREGNNMRTEILTRLIIVGLGSEDYL